MNAFSATEVTSGLIFVCGRINFMKSSAKATGSSGAYKYRVPIPARILNTLIALVLCILGIYHFTQPNQAWRSGTTELTTAALLLVAGYLVSRGKAIVINLVVAVVVMIAGIRHLIHGGGWRSGTAELFFVVLLVVVAVIIYKNK
jgi:uncharacterized membrane protein